MISSILNPFIVIYLTRGAKNLPFILKLAGSGDSQAEMWAGRQNRSS